MRPFTRFAPVFPSSSHRLFLRRFVTPAPSVNPFYDVVVAGGGMVGASMAAALGHSPAFSNKKVLLLEGAPKMKGMAEVCREGWRSSQVCTVSPSSARLLASFGAWDNILATKRYRAVRRMHVWEACSDAAITFDGDAISSDLVAHIMENDVILAAVCQQLDAAKDVVEVKLGAKVKEFRCRAPHDESGTHWMRVGLEDGQTVETRLLIGADGHQSVVRRGAGIQAVKWDYDQRAVVAVVRLQTDGEVAPIDDPEMGGNDTAWQRFLPTGPLALLPLTPSSSCLIWSTSPDHARQLLALSEEEMAEEVNKAIWSEDAKDPMVGYLGGLLDEAVQVAGSMGLLRKPTRQLPPNIVSVVQGSRASFPLGLCHSVRYVARRTALIGDAAHRIHPLAGQGVNLGFGDVESLRDLLAESAFVGGDLGAQQTLLAYETQRQRRVVPIMAAVDAMHRIYGATFPPVVFLRSAICRVADTLEPLNSAIVKFATS